MQVERLAQSRAGGSVLVGLAKVQVQPHHVHLHVGRATQTGDILKLLGHCLPLVHLGLHLRVLRLPHLHAEVGVREGSPYTSIS